MRKLFLLFMALFCSCSPRISVSQSADVDYIILKTSVDGMNKQNRAEVAFYIDLPDSNNFAGTSFRVISQRVRSDTTQVSFLTGALFDSLAIGAKLEIIRTVNFDAALTKVQKRTVIDDFFTNNLSAFLVTWYAQHDFYGLERIVP